MGGDVDHGLEGESGAERVRGVEGAGAWLTVGRESLGVGL